MTKLTINPANMEGVLLDTQKELISMAERSKCSGFAQELHDQFTNPNLYSQMDFVERVKRCFSVQEEFTSIARFNTLFKTSRLTKKLYIKQFCPDPSRGLDADTLLIFKDCNYIKEGTNVVISGPTGTGKTALATAAGVEALQKGYTVAFYRMSDFCALIESKDPIGLARFRKRLKNVKCLILDDYGLTTLSDKVVAELNEIADVRYGLGSTIITSQLKKNGLKTLIAKSPIRDALADRLFRASDVEITLSGASWRGSANELKGAK